jgi:hypothetical protein
MGVDYRMSIYQEFLISVERGGKEEAARIARSIVARSYVVSGMGIDGAKWSAKPFEAVVQEVANGMPDKVRENYGTGSPRPGRESRGEGSSGSGDPPGLFSSADEENGIRSGQKDTSGPPQLEIF